MSREERYGTRDLAYSAWHRRQGRLLAYIDLDAIEVCAMCKQPLALIELAQDVGQSGKATTIIRRLARLANLPAFLVFYSKDGSDTIIGFRVQQVAPERGKQQSMTPGEYVEFLCALRDGHPCTQWNNPRSKK